MNERKRYCFEPDKLIDSEEYEPYWCLICGIREDEEELLEQESTVSGIVYPPNSGEITASETYLCARCNFLISLGAENPYKQTKLK